MLAPGLLSTTGWATGDRVARLVAVTATSPPGSPEPGRLLVSIVPAAVAVTRAGKHIDKRRAAAMAVAPVVTTSSTNTTRPSIDRVTTPNTGDRL
ncbi:MAG: hypothetical protein KJP12_06275 [Acidimicrobiia bacterium]|nr:hypothetical protein [Acidimicrobiia bacterium]